MMRIMSKRGKVSLSLLLLSAAASAVLHSGCAARQPEVELAGGYNAELKVGGLYSIDEGDGDFRVVKILALDDAAVHVAMYANTFHSRPKTVDPAKLSLRDPGDAEGIAVMHIPLSRETFLRDRPVFITQTPVTEDELEGYHMWKEAGAEVFR